MEEKFKGTLLGLATGDALGAPLEFMWQNQIQIKHGWVNSMIGGGWLDLRAGQYTEETILMMALAESLLENKKLNREDLIQRYMRWYGGNPQDIGPTTRAALALINEGKSFEDASKLAYDELVEKCDDADPLTRVIPLALFYYQDLDKLVEETIQDVKLTHFDKRVSSGAACVNLIIAKILQGDIDRKKILEEVGELIEDHPANLYNVLPDVDLKTVDDLGVSSRVLDILEGVIWAWLKTESFEKAVTTVVNLGGDSDMRGALTGAITGAYYGVSNIPEKWLKFLQDKNIISQISRKLYKLANAK